jgi:hypothetical protein
VCSDLSVPTRPFVRRAETKQSVEETGVVTSDFDYWHILAIMDFRRLALRCRSRQRNAAAVPRDEDAEPTADLKEPRHTRLRLSDRHFASVQLINTIYSLRMLLASRNV